MKKLTYLFALAGLLGMSSCNDYLDIVPKGNKIPTTLADYEALLRNEYTISQTPVTNALYLLNDQYMTKSSLGSPTLNTANYLWDENADRITLNNSDEGTYYYLYGGISSCNLIVENAPTATESTEEERNEVIAYAKVIRAYNYFVLANYYADTYETSTAAEKLSVPLITSANISAPYRQVSIAEIYDFILKDIQEAIDGGLPAKSQTVLHPNLGAAYALLARVYLQMGNYSEALRHADLALGQNDALYDWNAFYNAHQATIEKADDYTNLPSPMGFDYVETYYFRHGIRTGIGNESNIPIERGERFEAGDARFLSRWKRYTTGDDTYYRSVISGYFNHAGLTTAEVYLIKAECQARLASGNDFTEAMNTLNTVRKTRIRPDVYQPAQASTLAEAIDLIRRTKDNELIFSIVPFADTRRFNSEGTYARTLTKTYEGKTLTLAPDSHLWTMPFPAGALNNPGNGSIQQNVNK